MQAILNNKYLLLIFAIVEVLCSSLFLHFKWFEFATVLFFLSGIIVALVPIFIEKPKIKSSKTAYYIFITLLIIVFGYLISNCFFLYSEVRIDSRWADMLPVIDILSSRFVNGEEVYAPIQELWNGFQPKYLPAMWFGFIPTQLLNVDIRWTTIFAIIIGLAFSLKLWKVNKNWTSIFIPVLLFSTFWYTSKMNHHYFTMTQEGLIVGYYLILAYAISSKKYILQGIFIGLCLMSRYSFIFWLPMYGLFLFIFENKKGAIKVVIFSTLTVVSLLLITGAYNHLDVFLSVQSNYLNRIEDISNKASFYPMIKSSLGIAKFYSFEDLKYLHKTSIVFAIGIPILLFSLFIKFKDRFNVNFYGICSLKLSLVFFYNMLSLPYLYLFFTSTFFTFAIVQQYYSSTQNE